ncbi:hypothetical protein P7K49_017694 [Saguinus oedipus]|uniref:Diphthine--ammonia ligase n=1 Tax=Saguinus oedipus TaxID=9490 RepID=A0ABQ9V554_SAGOE|nr:hypothetical protein P7K49_017694 [Saguinus oedipus]
MRVAALISGGKDSCYNMMQCIAAGHQIVALANLRPAENQENKVMRLKVGSDELDSYMYQTVGHHAIDLYAEAMALPLYRRTIRGRSLDTRQVYTKCEGDEVEDLYELLKLVKVTVTQSKKLKWNGHHSESFQNKASYQCFGYLNVGNAKRKEFADSSMFPAIRLVPEPLKCPVVYFKTSSLEDSFLGSFRDGITGVTLLAEYDALNLQDFHMLLEVGSQAIVYRTPNELCTHSKFDKHTFPPFISEIAECEV